MNLAAMNGTGRRPHVLQERIFTISQARRALVYLQPVLADAVEAYEQAQSARLHLCFNMEADNRAALCQERDAAIARLNRTIDEIHAVGVCMVNLANGWLSMKVRERGRVMCLIWRLGEPVREVWRDIDAADQLEAREAIYAARQG